MTDDELDLLASAYVDGEATPEEVALVERDPELLARVELFRGLEVEEPATPSRGQAGTHLAAAMAEFERLTADGTFAAPTTGPEAGTGGETEAGAGPEAEAVGTDDADEAPPLVVLADATTEMASGGDAPVVDLRERAAGRAARASRPRTMPSWLPAAAAVLIFGGGAVFALGRLGAGGGDDTEETASLAESDESTEAADAGSDESADAASMAESAAMEESEEESDDEAMEDEEAMEEEAVAESAPATEDRATDEGDDTTDDAAEDDSAGDGDAEGDFVDLAPLLFFDPAPESDADLDGLELPPLVEDLTLSSCGPEIEAPSLGELVGFVPVEVEGQTGELFVFENPDDGTEVRLLVGGDCLPVIPTP